jgi:5-methylcytosine-specific restriction endonuclease McrA
MSEDRKLTTREEALENKEKKYFTGQPCAKGHVSERYTGSRECVFCRLEINRQNYKNNKEKISAQVAIWRKNNREKIREINKRYYQMNIDKEIARREKYRENNKTKIQEINKRYRENNKETMAVLLRNRRARKRNAEGRHTFEEIMDMLESQQYKCAVCFVPVSFQPNHIQRKLHVDHVVPLVRDGSNSILNLQGLCQPCNQRKSSKLMHEWLGPNYAEAIANKVHFYLKCEAVTLDDQ